MTGLGRKQDRAELPQVGDRARLCRLVERFPHFWIAAGALGTVTEASENLIALRMDEHVSGAEEWDSELCWTADDGALYLGPETERIARAFYADVEIIDSTEGTVERNCPGGAGSPSKLAFGALNRLQTIASGSVAMLLRH